MTSLQSSNLRAADHDPVSGILTIWFVNRSVYEYYHVPRRVFRELCRDDSPGGYHHAEIVGHYRYRRIR